MIKGVIPMSERNGKRGIGGIIAAVIFFAAAAAALVLIFISPQCGGSREIKQVQVEIPTTTTTTSTTTTTTTTTTTMATTTTTTEPEIDYEMKLDISYVSQYKNTNPDVIGWIYIDGTIVDYPVVQGADNSTYIHSDWMGNYSYNGCIYEDYRGKLDEGDLTLFYGHNLANGSMFSTLKQYLGEEWGKNHKYIEIASEEKRYLYEVISVNVLYGQSGASFPYWIPSQQTSLEITEEQYEEYVKNVKSTANIWFSEDDDLPEYGENIIALQTCNSGSDDGMRCVVFAKRLGER